MIESCSLCPRSCKARREQEQGEGYCHMGCLPRVARIAPHMWEEPCISGKNGSGAVFFSGCTMSCVYCQNYEISRGKTGRYITCTQLAEEYKRLEDLGVHNINLVTPSHFLDSVIRSLDIYRPEIPVIYNCGGYETSETVNKLKGYVDVFLPDFKYSDNELAVRLSGAPHYRETAVKAIEQMYMNTGDAVYDGNGMIQRGVIVRHLILPNHTRNSIGVMEILHEHFGNALPVSLMAQYTPTPQTCGHRDLNRRITRREYEKVLSVMLSMGLDGYTQSLSSAGSSYVPDWQYDSSL